ncbi:hypothetical protein [Paraburkholderia kururiensis]|jgi:hypothetical protein|uniref:hypothetical protein n=1 Tax=Paraburkholderia kururiensis TaxID=984307 RepID=UPI0018F643A6|nr:hypothetical protein [Paraburkholderia kururiensis]
MDDVMRCLCETGAMLVDHVDSDAGARADASISAITDLAARVRGAAFVSEVLSGIESLGALRETFGMHAVDYVVYLADAVATGGAIDLPLHQRGFAAFIDGLPGGAQWRQHMRLSTGIRGEHDGHGVDNCSGGHPTACDGQ